MHVLEDLSYELEDMIEPIVKKGDISPTELDNVYKAAKTMYYIETIGAMKEYGNSENSYAGGSSYRGGSYRYDGRSYDGMSYRGSYDGSYDGRRGMDGDGDGRYSERRGRDSRGRYTSRDGYSRADEMMSKLERMLDEAGSETERQTIRECMRKLER